METIQQQPLPLPAPTVGLLGGAADYAIAIAIAAYMARHLWASLTRAQNQDSEMLAGMVKSHQQITLRLLAIIEGHDRTKA